jgi:hypothetical protein
VNEIKLVHYDFGQLKGVTCHLTRENKGRDEDLSQGCNFIQ